MPILCQISNLRDVGEGEDSLARGTPRKATTGQNLQQLDEVPRSLGGRSEEGSKEWNYQKLEPNWEESIWTQELYQFNSFY